MLDSIYIRIHACHQTDTFRLCLLELRFGSPCVLLLRNTRSQLPSVRTHLCQYALHRLRCYCCWCSCRIRFECPPSASLKFGEVHPRISKRYCRKVLKDARVVSTHYVGRICWKTNKLASGCVCSFLSFVTITSYSCRCGLWPRDRYAISIQTAGFCCTS